MSVFRTWYDRFQTWLDYTVVADDPNPEPTGLDRIGGTYPTHAQVAGAIIRGTTGPAGTTLLKPQDVERATREVVGLFDPAPEARAAVEAAEADAWDSRGEVPPGISFGEYTDRMGRLAGPHERDDRWLRLGRGGVR